MRFFKPTITAPEALSAANALADQLGEVALRKRLLDLAQIGVDRAALVPTLNIALERYAATKTQLAESSILSPTALNNANVPTPRINIRDAEPQIAQTHFVHIDHFMTIYPRT